MRYLKALGFFILGVIICFFGLGFIKPSVSYESEVTVNKSAKEAWAVMSDPDKLPQWINGFQKTELVSGTANTVGAVSKNYILENGKEMTMQETITAIKPYEHMAMNFTMDFMDMDYELDFEEQNGQTKITTKTTASGNGIISRSIVAMIPTSMKAQEDENLNKLKGLIESNTIDYYPEPKLDMPTEVIE